jgi:hypothetical protein
MARISARVSVVAASASDTSKVVQADTNNKHNTNARIAKPHLGKVEMRRLEVGFSVWRRGEFAEKA